MLVLGLLALAAAAGARAGERSVLVLGDSISAAYGMSLEQGWVALLETELAAAGRDIDVVNASISGETTSGGLRRLPRLLEEHEPELVIVELGANDGLRGYPLTRMRDNLSAIVSLAHKAGAGVVLLPMEIPPNYGPRYTAEFRETFQRVAADSGAVLAPFILEEFAADLSYTQADGIHPTADAQAMMLDTVWPTILQALPGT